MGPESFRTDRLVAERLRAEDLGDLRNMHGDPRVMATLGGVRSDSQTRRFLDQNLKHWARHGYGLWMFRDRSDGRFVGRGGLRHVHVGGRDEVELAYALMPEFWCRGLATEMARAILDVAVRQLGLTDIVCFTMTTNQASRRVMEKVGFAFERDIVYAECPHVLCRLAASTGGDGR